MIDANNNSSILEKSNYFSFSYLNETFTGATKFSKFLRDNNKKMKKELAKKKK